MEMSTMSNDEESCYDCIHNPYFGFTATSCEFMDTSNHPNFSLVRLNIHKSKVGCCAFFIKVKDYVTGPVVDECGAIYKFDGIGGVKGMSPKEHLEMVCSKYSPEEIKQVDDVIQWMCRELVKNNEE